MSETAILCRDCEKIIGPNIIDTEKPCCHILITEFTEKYHLGRQEDSFLLCKNCFTKRLYDLFKKEMPKLGTCKICKLSKYVRKTNVCRECRMKEKK